MTVDSVVLATTLDSVARFHGDELQVEHEVPVASTANEVRFARDEDDMRWVAKLPCLGDSEVIAEIVGWLLSRMVGGAVASACGVWSDAASQRWVLSRFVRDAEHWSPATAADTSNLEALGRVLAVDGVIGNGDRHARNILRANAQACAIDFGAAVVGHPRSLAQGTWAGGPPPRRLSSLAEGLCVAEVVVGLRAGIEALQEIDRWHLRHVADCATAHLDAAVRDSCRRQLEEVLEERCRLAQSCNNDLLTSTWP